MQQPSPQQQTNIKTVGDITIYTNKLLGKGAFAKVYLGLWQKSHEAAVKVIPKNQDMSHEQIQNEIDIMTKLKHPNIVRMFSKAESANNMYVVTEFCPHGTLRAFLDKKIKLEGPLQEEEVKPLFDQVVRGLGHLHEKGIVHRDLKLENILVGKAFTVKINDFGTSRFQEANEMLSTVKGTPLYMAPEVIIGTGHNEKYDIWSLGVILYEILFAQRPITAHNLNALKQKLEGYQGLDFPQGSSISEDARGLLQMMMNKDPNQRPSCDEIMKHPWAQQQEDLAQSQVKDMLQTINNLSAFDGSNQKSNQDQQQNRNQDSKKGQGKEDVLQNFQKKSSQGIQRDIMIHYLNNFYFDTISTEYQKILVQQLEKSKQIFENFRDVMKVLEEINSQESISVQNQTLVLVKLILNLERLLSFTSTCKQESTDEILAQKCNYDPSLWTNRELQLVQTHIKDFILQASKYLEKMQLNQPQQVNPDNLNQNLFANFLRITDKVTLSEYAQSIPKEQSDQIYKFGLVMLEAIEIGVEGFKVQASIDSQYQEDLKEMQKYGEDVKYSEIFMKKYILFGQGFRNQFSASYKQIEPLLKISVNIVLEDQENKENFVLQTQNVRKLILQRTN